MATGETGASKSQKVDEPGFWRKEGWRWIAIVVVTGLLIAVFVWVPVCEQVVAGDQAIEICRRMTLTDIPVIGAAIVIILLAYPMFTEFSLFGVSLKREVAKNAEKTAKLEDRIDSIIAIANATASNHVVINVPTQAEVDEARNDLAIQGVSIQGSGFSLSDTNVSEEEEIALLSRELIRNWEVLREAAYRTIDPRGIPTLGYGNRTEFGNEYAAPLDVVRQTRNAVAHGVDVPLSTLKDVVAMSISLISVLRVS